MNPLKHLRLSVRILILPLIFLAACDSGGEQPEQIPTATLANIVSMTPRFTATPVPSKTPLPTFTFTPSESPIPPTPSDTPSPTPIPPIMGIVNSLQTINVREGPGGSFSAFEAVNPGTGVEVIGKNDEETWLLVRLDDGREGWVYAPLVRIQPTSTPFPTMTPSPDLTRLFLGTPLPTAVIGGGTVTPTPPISVVTPTPVTNVPATQPPEVTEEIAVPVIDVNSINLTATALVAGVNTPTPSPTRLASIATATGSSAGTSTNPTVTRPPVSGGSVSVQDSVRVFALCDNGPALGGDPAPTDLAAGSTIVIWWAWFAQTEDQIQQHLNNATYEVRVDGELMTGIAQYQTPISKPGNDHVVYWYVPYPAPLTAGDHRITYRVTWKERITDGYDNYGPGSLNPVEEGSCTFTVR